MVKVNIVQKDGFLFEELVEIIKILRSPEGCPWDREQTHKSIRNEFVEETYEAVDAIDREDDTDLCEELGDVLLQILLHCQIASENNAYSIDDVINGIAKKMILRHPHVFGDVVAETTDKVLENWDNIKRDEKHQTSFTDTLKSVPMSYPSLMRAAKVQKRAAKAGVTMPDKDKLLSDAENCINSLKAGNDNSFETIGELLFTLCALMRVLKIDGEETLNKKTDKFIADFEKSEKLGFI